MRAEDRLLSKVFFMPEQLMVPMFQRPYVWNAEDNWMPLWESIEELLHQKANKPRIQPNFLGSIVLQQLSNQIGEVGVRHVIDGQQRLTTLQVLFAVLRDYATECGSKDYVDAFRQLCENKVPQRKDPTSIFKVWPTNIDREHFTRTMMAGSLMSLAEQYKVTANSKDFGHLIPSCYAFFYERVTQFIQSKNISDKDERFETLYQIFMNHLILVVVELDRDDDPQVIFETMNALWTPLTPSDLIKNLLFHKAKSEGADVEALYHDYWQALDDNSNYWRAEISQGRLKWMRLDMFFSHYMTLQKRDIVSMSHLYGEARDYYESSAGNSTAKHIQDVNEYASVFMKFDSYPEESREYKFFQRLQALETTTTYPILLEALRDKIKNSDIHCLLDYIESYLVRRAVCGLTPKNYNRLFIDLIRYLEGKGLSSRVVAQFLLERTGETVEWPSDSSFGKAFLGRPIYRKQKIARMVLEAIESAMQTSKSERISIKDKLTIEHIMPQDWRENWALPDGAPVEHGLERDEAIHRFGNLTLVTKALNPSLSNSPWTEKRLALMDHSALALNRRLRDIPHWNDGMIEKRGEELLKVALMIWPKPS